VTSDLLADASFNVESWITQKVSDGMRITIKWLDLFEMWRLQYQARQHVKEEKGLARRSRRGPSAASW
jgi:hypothetical protein